MRCCQGGAAAPTAAYRVVASKGITGKDVGPFKYYGTRPDDPNDIHPHEHRRELRAMRVFGAWLNHDDSRAINTRDFLQDVGRPQDRAALPDRLRLDAGQRQHARAGHARGQRIHLGGAPDV